VNGRVHRVTQRTPEAMLAQELGRLHPLPTLAHTVCFGETRKVSEQSTISIGSALYSVPSALIEQKVWARADGDELIVIHLGPDGPREVARHQLTTPGRPSIQDAHYPPKPPGALERVPRAQSAAEAAFLQIGPGASAWLTRAAAAGAGRVRRKMAEAVDLAKLHGPELVEEALRVAADAGRFDEGALAAILAHQHTQGAQVIAFPAREASSLQRSTSAWEGFGA
jgi:hypothetical protein